MNDNSKVLARMCPEDKTADSEHGLITLSSEVLATIPPEKVEVLPIPRELATHLDPLAKELAQLAPLEKSLEAAAQAKKAFDEVHLLKDAGGQLAIIHAPEGFDIAQMAARKGTEGGKTLSIFYKNSSGKTVPTNGWWTTADITEVEDAAAAAAEAQASLMLSMGFQLISAAVGQAHMAEINMRLANIESSLGELLARDKRQRESKLKGVYDRLVNEYAPQAAEIKKDPIRLQAVSTELERFATDMSASWSYSVDSLRAFGATLPTEKRVKEDNLENSIKRFNELEQDAAVVFLVAGLVEQVRMELSDNYSDKRLASFSKQMKEKLAEHNAIREDICGVLFNQIHELRFSPVAFPDAIAEERDADDDENILKQMGRGAKDFFDRALSDNPIDAAKKHAENRRNDLRNLLLGQGVDGCCSREADELERDLRRTALCKNDQCFVLADENNLYLVAS